MTVAGSLGGAWHAGWLAPPQLRLRPLALQRELQLPCSGRRDWAGEVQSTPRRLAAPTLQLQVPQRPEVLTPRPAESAGSKPLRPGAYSTGLVASGWVGTGCHSGHDHCCYQPNCRGGRFPEQHTTCVSRPSRVCASSEQLDWPRMPHAQGGRRSPGSDCYGSIQVGPGPARACNSRQAGDLQTSLPEGGPRQGEGRRAAAG